MCLPLVPMCIICYSLFNTSQMYRVHSDKSNTSGHNGTYIVRCSCPDFYNTRVSQVTGTEPQGTKMLYLNKATLIFNYKIKTLHRQ
ncbi:hypothetical protein GDO78_012501 [Eleutherodactylus coqui]|uniref:Uncharacterized protein n=1 Tax=Eleutherodactylus coqui TaxID=57060 RepID=A0A8J6F1I3_ELECQ|nr:hypothetical protein GDO78_012501 [Eleutherodactylus coqui]